MTNVTDARLTVDGTTRELSIERSTVGNDGVSMSTLLRDTGLYLRRLSGGTVSG